ncbi:alpha/beta hydrolase [Sediminibacterium soli]|uniref:alpha/beta hydrolase n=1 Tax=Sediminibacterium soli TaxID=2698829 RepID=UPI001379E21D|nr:alpha/beta hydrolase-fold protein [Sediminibacterium soli]NCI45820.1 esterase family protein [Sediminibacterium soli]
MSESRTVSSILIEQKTIFSEYLEREVVFDVYLPVSIGFPDELSLLLFNDGQDLPKMPFDEILESLNTSGRLSPLLCVGIYCGAERKMEYGVAYSADYKGRGAKAGLYTRFIFDELIPFIRKTYNIPSFRDKSFAGFSLGALSAMDIAWNHGSEFTRVGMFSASLWWRRKSYDEGYDDEQDRLMHLQVRKGIFHPWLRFFIECGEQDETADRNNNGIIDSIDDALDLIFELKAKGYTDEHIHYLQMPSGKHEVATWAKAMPAFLKWGWGKTTW